MLLLTQNLAGGGGGYAAPDLSWDFNNGVDGVKVDVADTPSAGDDAFASVTENTASGGHFKYSNVSPAHGALGLRVETGVTAVSCYAQWDITGSGLDVYMRSAVRIPSGLTFAARFDWWQYRDASTRTRFAWNTSRQLQVVNGSTVVGTMTTALAFDTTYRVEGRMFIDAAAGVLELKLFTGDSETADEVLTVTGLNTGTVECTNVRMGNPFATANLGPVRFDDWGISYTGYMGPAGTGPGVVDVPAPLVVRSTPVPASSPIVIVSRPAADPVATDVAPARPVVVAGLVAPLAGGSVATVRRGPVPVERAARPVVAAAAFSPPAVPVVLVARPGADPVVVTVDDVPAPVIVAAGQPPSSSATVLVVRALVDALAEPTVPSRPTVVTASPVPPATGAPSTSRAAAHSAPATVVPVRPVVVASPPPPPLTPAPSSARPALDSAAVVDVVPVRPVVVPAGPVPPAAAAAAIARPAPEPATAIAGAPRPLVITDVRSAPAPAAAAVLVVRTLVPHVPAPRPVIATSTVKPAEVAAAVITRRVPGALAVSAPRPLVLTAPSVPPHPGRAVVTRALVDRASSDFYATAGSGVLVSAAAGSSTATAAAGWSPSTLAPAAGSGLAQAPSGSSPATGVPTAGQG